MSSITIRNLDESVKQKLRVRAALHGRSMEDEARTILRVAAEQEVLGCAEVARAHPRALCGAWRCRTAAARARSDARATRAFGLKHSP